MVVDPTPNAIFFYIGNGMDPVRRIIYQSDGSIEDEAITPTARPAATPRDAMAAFDNFYSSNRLVKKGTQ